MPWKQAVIPFLDEITSLAGQIGAVNTVIPNGERLVGDNTDSPGFAADLSACFPGLRMGGSALILGAGGSAPAVAHALLQTGWTVFIAARRLDQAEELKSHLQHRLGIKALLGACLLDSSAVHRLVRSRKISLVVNCTPLGMAPGVHASPWPVDVAFPAEAAVYDLVYNPVETELVRRARRAGLAAVSGGGMLVEQAALAFECWTGRPAPRAVMKRAFEIESQINRLSAQESA
jgi:shikimate dehydrogenase